MASQPTPPPPVFALIFLVSFLEHPPGRTYPQTPPGVCFSFTDSDARIPYMKKSLLPSSESIRQVIDLMSLMSYACLVG